MSPPTTPPTGAFPARRVEALRLRLLELRSLVVAFSGGVDSALLLAAATRALGTERVLAVTGDSASLSQRERGAVREVAGAIGVPHAFVETRELEVEGYRGNARSRCWFCKDELAGRLLDVAAERGFDHVATGTNADDLNDPFRPGIRAAAGRGLVTPLADAGLTKDQVRAVSRAWGLPTWHKPSSPCLSSRVAYGLTITRARLSRVEAAEQMLADSLRAAGIDTYDLRVRDLGERALIQVDRSAVARVAACDPALEAVRSAGFAAVEVDPRGFRSGALNEIAER
ncbi:ATP-dependent sacrificial sulfur transferase LarE [Nonomuraea sp. NN258]|uniref:ATP-dependent sacrificial sulfur transferase LarE n=1 Tax=Nonomuraea antri TaxID=2730852 RepID=UPI0015682271|nr:ATP-dependent sacrificial sulfur transferase LarE [Nonomuraea antri]NRQ30939.1 ATP-dependent sacrificial sulfur transferase LarE [Nonomuraea antri]